jgi:hypothetical protein
VNQKVPQSTPSNLARCHESFVPSQALSANFSTVAIGEETFASIRLAALPVKLTVCKPVHLVKDMEVIAAQVHGAFDIFKLP